MTPNSLHDALRRVNRGVGLLFGVVLLGTVALILVEIITRRVAFGLLGGTDEIAGYVMAAVASWGAAYALIERAHVRIDLAHRRASPMGRAMLDILSLLALCAVAVVVTIYGWEVISKSLDRGSRANTVLETPLWIPQAFWLAGWAWFSLASFVMASLSIWSALRRDWSAVGDIAGPELSEDEAVLEEIERSGAAAERGGR